MAMDIFTALTGSKDSDRFRFFHPELELLEDRLPPGEGTSILRGWGGWAADFPSPMRDLGSVEERVFLPAMSPRMAFPNTSSANSGWSSDGFPFPSVPDIRGLVPEGAGPETFPVQKPASLESWLGQVSAVDTADRQHFTGPGPGAATFRSDAWTAGNVEGYDCGAEHESDYDGGLGIEESESHTRVTIGGGDFTGVANADTHSSIPQNEIVMTVSAGGSCILYDASAFASGGFWETLTVTDPGLKPGDPLSVLLTFSINGRIGAYGGAGGWAGIRDAKSIPQDGFPYPFDRSRDAFQNGLGSADSPESVISNGHVITAFLYAAANDSADVSATFNIRATNGDDLIIKLKGEHRPPAQL